MKADSISFPWFPLTCSIHPVFLSPFVDSGPIHPTACGLRCDTATRDGKLHSLSHPPLCLSRCSIVYPYLLGFLQSNQPALSLSLSLGTLPLSPHPPSSFPTPTLLSLSLSLLGIFSQRLISTPPHHPSIHPFLSSRCQFVR